MLSGFFSYGIVLKSQEMWGINIGAMTDEDARWAKMRINKIESGAREMA